MKKSPNVAQEEALEKFFNLKGYTNNLQADFFLRLGNAIQESTQSKNLKKTFPKPKRNDEKEFNQAFSLAYYYLEQNKMVKTKQYLTSNSNGIKPSSVDELIENLSLEESHDPLKQLVRDHKAKHLLDPKTVNIEFNQEYLE